MHRSTFINKATDLLPKKVLLHKGFPMLRKLSQQLFCRIPVTGWFFSVRLFFFFIFHNKATSAVHWILGGQDLIIPNRAERQ